MNADETENARPGTLPYLGLSVILFESYRRVVGKSLVPGDLNDVEAALWLYEDAPCCVVAHNTEADPRFIYANKAAQRRFEYSWSEFTALPSRLSAEEPNRTERQHLLSRVARDGFADRYKGLRISRSGRRFFIEDGTVWQLTDSRGVLHGQGAMFPTSRDLAQAQADEK